MKTTTQTSGGYRDTTPARPNRRRTDRAANADPDSPFRALFRDASYYSTGRNWNDYAPAYRYGEQAFACHRGRRFDEVEHELSRDWIDARQGSRLSWVEARGAVHDAWRRARDRAFFRAHTETRAEAGTIGTIGDSGS
ncbi:hypothetical protein [Luteimonas vadosa]|uniref:DUF2934 domain-containing protein n=1 Tax=Luteimonas vadosa TaxID=1165507 RepID=A0ABP9DUN5_9GAMM